MKIRMENLYEDIGTKGYKLCIFTFPEAASGSSYGHLFYVTNNCSVPAISIGSFWSVLKKSVWHFMASQKYSINVHLPTSGRAVVLPDRMAKRKPRGGLLQRRLNDIQTQKIK